MGFPNIDKRLIKVFMAGFNGLKMDPSPLADIFDDFDQGELAEVAQYIGRKEFTLDLRQREGSQVFIMPDFPRLDMPFPQIAVNLGKESSERYMGDETGESEPVKDSLGNLIGWDVIKGYYAQGNWNATIVAATKDETIWLSRCCQYFICQALMDLEKLGLMEIDITLADMQPAQDQLPMSVFSRAINISGKTVNTWKIRIPAMDYQTGSNTAL